MYWRLTLAAARGNAGIADSLIGDCRLIVDWESSIAD
jgi:hypothetical protein